LFDCDEENIETVDVEAALKATDDEECEADYIQLPNHHRCVCHSLNLVATTDADKALKVQQYSRSYHGATGKCQAIWNAVHRSSKASDAVADICTSAKLFVPCQTRWNSKYDALRQLIQLQDKVGQICDAVGTPKLKQTELEFLKEYVSIVEPLAVTLDQLQGDKECFLGMLLPKLIQLRYRLSVFSQRNLVYCMPLVSSLLCGLNTRFSSMFNYDFSVPEAKDAILAAVSHPQYKLKWVPPDNRNEVSQAFVEAVAMMDRASTTVAESTGSQLIAGLEADDDYGYGENNSSSSVVASSTSQVKAEAMNFLSDADKSLSRLHFFPAVKRLFLKFNTALPSSAPVERLFSIAGLIETPRRNRLSDSNFEKLLMLKVNKV